MSLLVDEHALRRWIAHTNRQSAAAGQLLLEHDHWFRRRDFVDVATRFYPTEDMVSVDWRIAETVADQARGSSSELAILKFAAVLGLDRYRLCTLGAFNSAAVVRAVTNAVGSR